MSLFESDGFRLFAVSAVVMGLSHTIAKERIFEELRNALGNKETLVGYLVSCPYCVSHWISFLVVPLTGTLAIRIPWDFGWASSIADGFLSSILVVVIAAFLRVGFYFVDESQGLIRRRQKVVEEEATLLEERTHPQPPSLH